jgi:hypothetical protein
MHSAPHWRFSKPRRITRPSPALDEHHQEIAARATAKRHRNGISLPQQKQPAVRVLAGLKVMTSRAAPAMCACNQAISARRHKVEPPTETGWGRLVPSSRKFAVHATEPQINAASRLTSRRSRK